MTTYHNCSYCTMRFECSKPNCTTPEDCDYVFCCVEHEQAFESEKLLEI